MRSLRELRNEILLSSDASRTVGSSRQVIIDIIERRDPRLLVVLGPCSIHGPKAGFEYAERLCALCGEVDDKVFVVMRIYFEKPRTTVDWKGFINDPLLNDFFAIKDSIRDAR